MKGKYLSYNKFKSWWTILLLLLIITVGYVIKLKQAYNYTKSYKELIFTGIDSYYYARLANDLLKGNCKCGETDFLSFVPDSWVTGFPKYPDIPPFISSIAFILSKMTDENVEFVAFYLYPALSLLFIVPFFYLFREYINSIIIFILSIVIIISSPIFYLRTSPGWLDNDVLNLFFPILLSYLLVLLYKTKNYTYKILIIFLLIDLIYYFWYPKPFLQLYFLIFLIITLALKRISKILWIFLIPLLGLFLALNINKIYYLAKYYLFERQSLYGEFPNIYTTISELQGLTINDAVKLLGINKIFLIISLFGIILLIVYYKKNSIPIIPIISLSLLPFFFGLKFLIYLIPAVSLGLSFTIYRIERYLFQKKPLIFLLFKLSITIFVIWFTFMQIKFLTALTPRPVIPPDIVLEIKQISKLTPINSWILSWWDYGEAIKYYANRATYHDPFNQNFPKTYLIAYAFTKVKDGRRFTNMVNAISFYTNADIVNWISAGKSREDILNKFLNFSGNSRNRSIYIFFSGDMLYKFKEIYKIASWGSEDQKNITFNVFGFCRLDINYILKCPEGLIVNPYTNEIYLKEEKYEVSKIIYRRMNGRIYKFELTPNNNLIAEIVETKRGIMVYILSRNVYLSPFNQLFILRNFKSFNLKLIRDNFPFGVLYALD